MKKNFRSILKSNLGFSLIEIVVVVAVSSLLLTGSTFLVLNSQKIEQNQQKLYWLLEQRLVIQKALQSENNWGAIKVRNPNMNCFDNNTSCAAFKTPQKLILPVGADVFDGTNAATGLDNNGRLCNQFNAANGNANCPFGVDLTWQALCNDSDCKKAQPKMQVSFKNNDPRSSTKVNLDSYTITAYRDSKTQDLSDICTKMGGTLVGTSCTIGSLNIQCDPGNTLGLGATFPLGFDVDGKVICGRPTISDCASTELMLGFSSNGNTVCAPKCSAPPPAPPVPPTPPPTPPTPPPADSCAATWCHLGKVNSCTRTNGVASGGSLTGATCTTEEGGMNPCENSGCILGGSPPVPPKDVNCSGVWTCDNNTGIETFNVTTQPSGNGTACPTPSTRNCDVDCKGSWSACKTDPVLKSDYREFIITQTKKNNGVDCVPNINGKKDACAPAGVCGQATWCNSPIVSSCTRYSDNTWKLTQTDLSPSDCSLPQYGIPSGAGKSCPDSVPACAVNPPPNNTTVNSCACYKNSCGAIAVPHDIPDGVKSGPGCYYESFRSSTTAACEAGMSPEFYEFAGPASCTCDGTWGDGFTPAKCAEKFGSFYDAQSTHPCGCRDTYGNWL